MFHLSLCVIQEEQNASSSANYDVEILHSSLVHRELRQSGLADSSSIPSKEGLQIMTVALKWCTPKSNAVGKLLTCYKCPTLLVVKVM